MTVTRSIAVVVAVAVPAALLMAMPGCGNKEEPYKPKPAWSGRAVNLPDVPTLPAKPIKVGDSYTVWGVMHQLRSIVHVNDVKDKDLSIVGWVVKTNFMDPDPNKPGHYLNECAVHKTGKGDPEGCSPPVPAFWIADEKGDTKNAIKVMGFASNWAQLYDQIEKDKKAKEGDEPVQDEFLGIALPAPVPNVDAKVKVSGTYGFAYTKSTSGIETDPVHGIMTYQKLEYIEKPPTPATLPGMKP